jgi:hypothetical protein
MDELSAFAGAAQRHGEAAGEKVEAPQRARKGRREAPGEPLASVSGGGIGQEHALLMQSTVSI